MPSAKSAPRPRRRAPLLLTALKSEDPGLTAAAAYALGRIFHGFRHWRSRPRAYAAARAQAGVLGFEGGQEEGALRLGLGARLRRGIDCEAADADVFLAILHDGA